MFEFEVFRKQMYWIEENTVLVTLFGLFGAPQSFGARGIVAPSLRPCERISLS